MTNDLHGKRIDVFRNGDVFKPAKKVVITPRAVRSYAQLLNQLTETLRLSNGGVRRLYALETGQRVTDLSEIAEGGIYVATAGEPLKKVAYPLPQLAGGGRGGGSDSSAEDVSRGRLSRPASRPMTRSNSAHSFRFSQAEEGPRQKDAAPRDKPERYFGTTARAYRVSVFVNGEFQRPPRHLTLNHKTCKNFEDLLHTTSTLLRLPTAVRKLYDIGTGRRLQDLTDVRDGMNLAALGTEAYKPGSYAVEKGVAKLFEKKPGDKRVDEEATRNIMFLRNGDAEHPGFNFPINERIIPTIPKLMDRMNAQHTLVGGLISRIYDLKGRRVRTIAELTTGEFYVIANDVAFIPADYNRTGYRTVGVGGLDGHTLYNEHMEKIRPVRDATASRGASRPASRGASRPASRRPTRPSTPTRDAASTDSLDHAAGRTALTQALHRHAAAATAAPVKSAGLTRPRALLQNAMAATQQPPAAARLGGAAAATVPTDSELDLAQEPTDEEIELELGGGGATGAATPAVQRFGQKPGGATKPATARVASLSSAPTRAKPAAAEDGSVESLSGQIREYIQQTPKPLSPAGAAAPPPAAATASWRETSPDTSEANLWVKSSPSTSTSPAATAAAAPVISRPATPAPDVEPDVEPEADVEPEVEAEPEAETETETETQPVTPLETDCEAELEAALEAEAEAEVEAEVDVDAVLEAEPEAESDAEPEVEPEVETEAEAEPDWATEAEADAQAATDDVEFEIEIDADLQAEAEAALAAAPADDTPEVDPTEAELAAEAPVDDAAHADAPAEPSYGYHVAATRGSREALQDVPRSQRVSFDVLADLDGPRPESRQPVAANPASSRGETSSLFRPGTDASFLETDGYEVYANVSRPVTDAR